MDGKDENIKPDPLGWMRTAIEAKLKAAQAQAAIEEEFPPEGHSPLAQEEENALTVDQSEADLLIARAEAALRQAETRDKESQTKLRELLADRVFVFMERWCAFVALNFWIYVATKKGDIPAEVMIALLTTTTVSVIGLVGFIVQGLFKSTASSQENGKEKGK
ncbi:hypothetical protein [Aeromonas hydrophila]|nr:hypothetical protein [Aeromonas hydrophila]